MGPSYIQSRTGKGTAARDCMRSRTLIPIDKPRDAFVSGRHCKLGLGSSMLHLLPLRWIAKGLLYVTTLAVFGATIAGLVGPEHVMHDAFALIRWVLMLETAVAAILFFGWRYIPGFNNRIFPDISGTWSGFIHYGTKEDPKKKDAVLHVYQSISKIRLVLETDESQSETLVALPERDEHFSRFKLFYIFENTRKEAVQEHPGQLYRGTAFIEMGPGKPDEINGSYFTDQKKEGSISFRRGLDPLINLSWYKRWWLAFLDIFAARGVSPYLGQRKYGP